MTGPSASILTHVTPRAQLRAAVARLTTPPANSSNIKELRARGCPLITSFGPEYDGELEGLREDGLGDVWDWLPDDQIVVAAMCGTQEDHNVLAEVCLNLALAVDGLVDFGGATSLGPTGYEATWRRPVRIENPNDLTGLLLATCYRTANGVFTWSHYCDTELLQSWLASGELRMVK